MTPGDAGRLLAIAAAFDNRKPDADTARAWAVVLDGYRFEDCRDAIVAHFRTSTAYLMPATILAEVRRVRAKRIALAGDLCPPAGLTEPQEREWLRAERARIGDGLPPTPDARELVARNMSTLPALGRRVQP